MHVWNALLKLAIINSFFIFQMDFHRNVVLMKIQLIYRLLKLHFFLLNYSRAIGLIRIESREKKLVSLRRRTGWETKKVSSWRWLLIFCVANMHKFLQIMCIYSHESFDDFFLLDTVFGAWKIVIYKIDLIESPFVVLFIIRCLCLVQPFFFFLQSIYLFNLSWACHSTRLLFKI